MRACVWHGTNDLRVENVPDPEIVNERDVIVRVKYSSVCGSDLYLLDGQLPSMKRGDVIGHEFTGEVVELGSKVKTLNKGDRVVVVSVIGCGGCGFCQAGDWSLCDNSNPNEPLLGAAYGYSPAGVFGYSHAFGGYAGSHAEYVRVPFADQGAFRVPDEISDEAAVFVSDAVPAGYMAADLCGIRPGDVVAVWGAGAVGQIAMRAALLMGAEQVIAIDRLEERLGIAKQRVGAECLNGVEEDVREALRAKTGGRGPDACIDAVGMEAHGTRRGPFDRFKPVTGRKKERPQALRDAILACKKGGTVAVVGVYAGVTDKFPIGAAMNKALTLRMGRQHGQKYVPRIFEHMRKGELNPAYLLTHSMKLEEAPYGYELFKHKEEGCLRAVFAPQSTAAMLDAHD